MSRFILFLAIVGGIVGLCCTVHSGTLPSGVVQSTCAMPATEENGKARRLFELTRNENRGLQWNDCLAEQAYHRARKMAESKQFGHKDPVTGTNPVWEMMGSCGSLLAGAENLAKGTASPETLHSALMKSPSHRQQILNTRYSQLGVGCSDNICVELFASL